MKSVVPSVLLLVLVGTVAAAAAQPHVDKVTFVQVVDAAEAVEAVRNGTLDMYYFGVPHSLVADTEGIVVHEVPAGGTLGLLLNPAEGDSFNPFSLQEIRFAVNYMVNREGIVEDLMDGYGTPQTTVFAPHDPDYIRTLDQTESFAISYDPDLARTIIHRAMEGAGAVMEDGVWTVDGAVVVINAFIREDPVRMAIGDMLASDLEAVGFSVERTYGNLARAFDDVYGSDPADFGWHFYTEGWGGGFSRYDDSSLASFYAPWASNMPGQNNPEVWNYEHDELDRITQIIRSGEYTGEEHRTELVRRALALGMQESVRIFVASSSGTYVVNERVDGVINHVGSGISHSLTLTNVQVPSNELTVGVKFLSQSSWNIVGGLGDVYSSDIAAPLALPSAVSHPQTGHTMPHAVQRHAVTAGPNGTLDVPADAMLWDPHEQRWAEVGEGTTATTVVTLNYTFSNWHHGQTVDINDVLYPLYFEREWGTITGPDDVTHDSRYTNAVQPSLEQMVGVRQTGPDSLEVYINYWHFDQAVLAGAGVSWIGLPWEVSYAAERIVADGLAEFSDTDALAHDVPWLSLIDPDDTALVRQYLVKFMEDGVVPGFLEGMDPDYYTERYRAAIAWIDEHGHAYIDNGPFMLASHDGEAGTAVLTAFRDETYPYPRGVWSQFSDPAFPTVSAVTAFPMLAGEPYSFTVFANNTDTLRYFLNYETGGQIHSGDLAATYSNTVTVPAEATADVDVCSLTLRVFALSDTVIIPDVHVDEISVVDCGFGLDDKLEAMGITADIEFLRTLAGVVSAAQQDGEVSLEDLLAVVDEEELSRASLVLLDLILNDEIDGDDLFEFIRP